ncbi:MAG TPA: acetyl-CoA carboxylase biotin carboxyl carrier protein [Candidatus Glassbacteria bacterium]|nr:acetyl-CoA carboxylase biotin carboxyl carrier protein [Candidatus Glassbacteria bacterium]
MDVRYLKRLIRVVEQSQISELEIEDQGTKVKIVKWYPPAAHLPAMLGLPHVPAHPAPVTGGVRPATAEEALAAAKSKLVEVKSPMVGTFFRAPSPGAPPFIAVGDRVQLGQTLCILEAMKLMNELECEVAGIVREICVENAQPVEFGSTLFLIEPES